MTDSSSQSDDTSCGSSRTGSRGSNGGGRSGQGAAGNGNSSSSSAARRRKGAMNAKERNLRRLESNERERMRMHSLNDAFQVRFPSTRGIVGTRNCLVLSSGSNISHALEKLCAALQLALIRSSVCLFFFLMSNLT